MIGIVLLWRPFAGHPRSHLAIGRGEELRPNDLAVLELPDSLYCIPDLDTLSVSAKLHARPFRLPSREIG